MMNSVSRPTLVTLKLWQLSRVKIITYTDVFAIVEFGRYQGQKSVKRFRVTAQPFLSETIQYLWPSRKIMVSTDL